MTDPREYTTDEVRQRFLKLIHDYIDYWEEESRTPDLHGKLSGLAFSILVILDGGAASMPGFIVAPGPHPEDKEFLKGEGENWYPENNDSAINNDIAGSLHDLFHNVGKTCSP